MRVCLRAIVINNGEYDGGVNSRKITEELKMRFVHEMGWLQTFEQMLGMAYEYSGQSS
jgi:hypothetical protein